MKNKPRFLPVAVLVMLLGLAFTADADVSLDRLVWAQQVGGAAADDVAGVEALADGSFVVLGRGEGPYYLSSPPEAEPYGASSFLAKYDAARHLVWLKRFDEGNTCVSWRSFRMESNAQDDSVFVGGGFYGEVTLGAGEINEIRYSTGYDCLAGAYVACFNEDGTLRWSTAAINTSVFGNTCSVAGIAVSPNGTSYVAYRAGLDITFAVGTPEETTVHLVHDNAYFIGCYNDMGRLQWLKTLPIYNPPRLAAMDGSCLCHFNSQVVNYGEDGNTIWTAPYPEHEYFWQIPGTQSFISATLIADNRTALRKFTFDPSGTINEQWSAVTAYNQGADTIYCRPDGSGCFTLFLFNEYRYVLQEFSATGTLGAIHDVGLTMQPRLSPAATGPGFYIFGPLDLSRIYGAGQPGEITLTSRGETDGFVALYGQEDLVSINAMSVGLGVVLLDPPGPSYAPGTVVTTRALPTFPGHDQFVEWQGDLAGNSSPAVTFPLNRNMDITAVFEELPGAAPLPTASIAGLALLGAAIVGAARLRRK